MKIDEANQRFIAIYEKGAEIIRQRAESKHLKLNSRIFFISLN